MISINGVSLPSPTALTVRVTPQAGTAQYNALGQTVLDNLRDKRTVVLNLENTNKDVSRRILDFVSGVAYAQDGKIKKVAVSTFIVTPYNVDILGDLIDELENNGVYF